MFDQIERNPHRSRIDIIESILNFLYEKGSVKKTHLLYATNLNTRSLEKYLKHLVSINAIKPVEDIKGRLRYVLTPYGRLLLKLIIKLHRLLEHPSHPLQYESELAKKIRQNKAERELSISIIIGEVQGLSGLIYSMPLMIINSEKYILVSIQDYEDDSDLVDELSKLLLYLVDTDENIIIILKNLDEYKKGIVKNIISMLTDKINVEEARYVIID